MTDDSESARRYWTASGRNGYNAVDGHRAGSSGTYGEPLIFRTRKDAERVSAALNAAYAAGVADAELLPDGTPRVIRETFRPPGVLDPRPHLSAEAIAQLADLHRHDAAALAANPGLRTLPGHPVALPGQNECVCGACTALPARKEG